MYNIFPQKQHKVQKKTHFENKNKETWDSLKYDTLAPPS
jgi:hypothetical protein